MRCGVAGRNQTKSRKKIRPDFPMKKDPFRKGTPDEARDPPLIFDADESWSRGDSVQLENPFSLEHVGYICKNT